MNYRFFVLLLFALGMFVSCSSQPVNKKSQMNISENAVYKSALSVIDEKSYNVEVINFNSSTVFLFSRKLGGLNKDKIASAIKKYWPVITEMLDTKITDIAVIDYEAPLGGGPMGQYVVGLYSSAKVPKKFQTIVYQATGWAPESSTMAYVNKHYSGFSDPEQAYIDDMVAHELGHTIFGFGLTKAPDNMNDWWFSFGLGLVYDRIAWSRFNEVSSPLFGAAVDQWKNVFSKNTKIDQKLIAPDVRKDAKFGLSRLQVYGHGKALVYLNELRQNIGAEEFDKAVQHYVSGPRIITYDDFLKFVPVRFNNDIKALEQKFIVR